MTATDATRTARGGRYPEVNGINLYYESHGSGPPLPRHVVEAFELLGGGQQDGGWIAAVALAFIDG
jgi:hypothetical protein